MAQPRTARLGLGFIWGILGFSLIGILILLSRGNDGINEYEEARGAERLKTRLELEDAARKKLSEYAWVNKEKGIVAVPIDRAMELTVVDLKSKDVKVTDEKAVIMPTLLVPPYLQDAAPVAPEGTEGAEAPAEGEAAPAAATEAAPAAEAATTEAEPAPEAQPEAAPAASETPSEPTSEPEKLPESQEP